jgi:hypothetical protein
MLFVLKMYNKRIVWDFQLRLFALHLKAPHAYH